MNRRGRPPHPDVLTPREWEVLRLLRENLSNEEIADHLGITVRTAKYHVSEILSKLGVSSRDEAAAWQPPPQPSWWRFAALPLAAKLASVAVVAAVITGVGILGWGFAATGGLNANTAPESELALPSPGFSMTREQALITAWPPGGDIRRVEVRGTTYGGVRQEVHGEGTRSIGPPDGTAAWVITYTGIFSGRDAGFLSGPRSDTPVPDVPSCRELVVAFPESDTGPTSRQMRPLDGDCPELEASRDLALIYGFRAAAEHMQYYVPEELGGDDALAEALYSRNPESVTVQEVSLREALALLAEKGSGSLPLELTGRDDDPVWFVTFLGHYLPPADLGSYEHIGPPPLPGCREVVAVLDAVALSALMVHSYDSTLCR
jgi:DNA-binding CsgD family transcriptional regulator